MKLILKSQVLQVRKNLLRFIITHYLPMMLFFYFTLISIFLYLNHQFAEISLFQTAITFASGIALWLLMELLLHRFVFQVNNCFPLMHKIHFFLHHVPRPFNIRLKKGRLGYFKRKKVLMPPLAGIFLYTALFLILNLFSKSVPPALVAGSVGGYLIFSLLDERVRMKPQKLILHRLLIRHLKLNSNRHYRTFGSLSIIWNIFAG